MREGESMRIIKNEKGFTLIEAIVTIAIVGIAFTPIAFIFNSSLMTSIETREQLVANQLAQKYVEEIKAFSINDLNNLVGETTSTTKDGYKIEYTINKLAEDYKIDGSATFEYDYKIELTTVEENKFKLYGASTANPQELIESDIIYTGDENIREINLIYDMGKVSITHSVSEDNHVDVKLINGISLTNEQLDLIECNAPNGTTNVKTRINVTNKDSGKITLHVLKVTDDQVNPTINYIEGNIETVYLNKTENSTEFDLIYTITVSVKKNEKLLNTVTATKII